MPEIKKQHHVELFVKFLYPGIILRGDAFTFDGEKIWDGNKPLSDKIIKNLIDRKIRKIYYKRISLAGKGKVKDPMIDKKIIDKAVNIAHELEDAITKKSIIPEAAVNEIVDNFIDGISTSGGTSLNLLELKEYDDYTYTHSINVCLIAILFAKKLSYNPKGLKVIGVAALLHDIGKLMVPIDILQKPGPLTSDEFDIVKKHPVFGYELIKSESDFGSLIQKAVLLHHEKYSGNGYPLGLRGERISQIAQIISLADVFDAITSEHPYKPSRPYWYALSQIKKEVGSHFLPRFAQTFVQDMPKYLTESAIFEKGTFVVLNTGEIGEVIDYRYPQTLRPVVNIYITAKKQIVRYPIPINLESDDTRTIENVFEDDAMINKLIEAKSKIHKRNNNNNMNSEKKDVAQQKEEDLNKLNNKQITIDKDLIEEDEGSLK